MRMEECNKSISGHALDWSQQEKYHQLGKKYIGQVFQLLRDSMLILPAASIDLCIQYSLFIKIFSIIYNLSN